MKIRNSSFKECQQIELMIGFFSVLSVLGPLGIEIEFLYLLFLVPVMILIQTPLPLDNLILLT